MPDLNCVSKSGRDHVEQGGRFLARIPLVATTWRSSKTPGSASVADYGVVDEESAAEPTVS